MNDDNVQTSPLDAILNLWRRRKWLMVVIFSSIAVLTLSTAVSLPSIYRSSTTMLFGQDEISESMVKTSAGNELALQLGIIQQAVLSRGQIQQIIEAYNLYPQLRRALPPEVAIERFRKDTKIEQRAAKQAQWGQNSIFSVEISYQGWEPKQAAEVANELARRFKQENRRLRTGQASRTTAFIAQELEQAKAAFIVEEKRINAFKNRHIGELPEQQQINLVTLGRLNTELRLNGEKQLRILSKGDAASLTATGEKNTSGLSGTERLAHLKRRLAEQRTLYTEYYPGIVRLKEEIRQLEQQMADGVSSDSSSSLGAYRSADEEELARLKLAENELKKKIARIMNRIEGTPKIDQQLKRFAYDYDSAKEEYLSLQKKYQDAQLAESLEAKQSQHFKVIEAAIPASYPTGPNRIRLMLAGLVLAGLVTAAVLFMVEIRDSSFHVIDDIRNFTSVPVLASVAHIQTPRERITTRLNGAVLLISFVIFIILLAILGQALGQGAEQLVWALTS